MARGPSRAGGPSPGGAAKPCPFCAIARGDAAAHRVYEDEGALAFLDRRPLRPGHLLLIPRAHVETLFDADGATLQSLALACKIVATGLKAAMGADGMFVAQNNVVSQSVAHLHVHLVPRTFGDRLFSANLVWKRTGYRSEDEAATLAARIAAVLRV